LLTLTRLISQLLILTEQLETHVSTAENRFSFFLEVGEAKGKERERDSRSSSSMFALFIKQGFITF